MHGYVSKHDPKVDEEVEQVELAVARLLRAGTVVASLLMASGLAVLLLGLPTSLGSGLVTAGIIVLVATPLLRVAAAFLIYFRLGDMVYALISLTVLVIVGVGIFMGKTH